MEYHYSLTGRMSALFVGSIVLLASLTFAAGLLFGHEWGAADAIERINAAQRSQIIVPRKAAPPQAPVPVVGAIRPAEVPPPPAEPPPPAPEKPARTAADASKVRGFVVYVGAYASSAMAESLAEKLRGHNLAAKTSAIERPGRTPLVSVWVGPFDARSGAEAVLPEIRAAGLEDTMIRALPSR